MYLHALPAPAAIDWLCCLPVCFGSGRALMDHNLVQATGRASTISWAWVRWCKRCISLLNFTIYDLIWGSVYVRVKASIAPGERMI